MFQSTKNAPGKRHVVKRKGENGLGTICVGSQWRNVTSEALGMYRLGQPYFASSMELVCLDMERRTWGACEPPELHFVDRLPQTGCGT